MPLYKHSKNITDKLSKRWSINITPLSKSRTKRRKLPTIDKPLSELNRLPKQLHVAVIGRFIYLLSVEKSRNKRLEIISKELCELWKEMNFLSKTKISVLRKRQTLIKAHDSFSEKPVGNECEVFGNVLDFTNIKGIWLSQKDKQLCELQISSKTSVGYKTNGKVKLHPSKQKLMEVFDTDINNLETATSYTPEEKIMKFHLMKTTILQIKLEKLVGSTRKQI